MRLKDLMESVSETLVKSYGGKVMSFSELPLSAQQAITHWMTVDGDRDGVAPSMRVGYVILPAEILKRVCWNAPMNDMRDDYETWEEYHELYWARENDAEYNNHLSDMWPVILYDDEGIIDGWHRLHWYLRNGVKNIPAVYLM